MARGAGLDAMRGAGLDAMRGAGLDAMRGAGLDAMRRVGVDGVRRAGLDALRRAGLDALRRAGLDALRRAGLDALRGGALVLLAWLCLTAAGAAQHLTFPPLTGRVVDGAGLLQEPDRAALTSELAALEARTTDQLVVVTLKSLQGTSIEDYGYQLGRAWRIGQKDRDSGALLIVDAADRQVRIEVGYGLEGTLTDAATKVIIESTILPAFKAGDFAGGIKAGTAQIVQLLEGDATAAPPAAAGVPDHAVAPAQPVWPIIAGGLACVVILIFCALHGGFLCQAISQMLFMVMLSGRGRGGGSDDTPRFTGGGGSFGGGGSSGSW